MSLTATAIKAVPDLDAYFRRIGVPESDLSAPDVATLARIVLGHAQSITFENLDKFTGHDIQLDLEALTAKLVHSRRGGGCYEQNLLLHAVLAALGYSTTFLAGRVVWNLADDAPMPPRHHMLLRVDLLEGPHIVDVGFGILTPTGVLALEPEAEQATPHEPFRLMPDGRAFMMEVRLDGEWRPLYRFDLAEMFLADFTAASWYNAHHPESLFINELLLARPDTGRRYTLRGSKTHGVQLGVHHLEGPTESRPLQSPAEVRASLEEQFQLDLSGLPDLNAALARLF
jgi:N-hydroxyarylamine O-acetyltransferase